MKKPLFVLGYPGPIGGACTELWHMLKLWRSAKWNVHLIPTWGEPPAEWQERCGAIGCITHVVAKPNRELLEAIPGLRGGTVISFCNDMFLMEAALFRAMGCKIVWSGCMNWLFDQEKRHYAIFGPFEAYHCQSKFQIKKLSPILSQYGARPGQIHLIRGAFDPAEFPFAPRGHDPDEAFIVGRLSRASVTKFSTNTWPILERVNYNPKKYRVLGWNEDVRRQIGEPPVWAETFPSGAMTSQEFIKDLHCYCQINGGDDENWPRSGLEAMSAGVPIVVEARGGFLEMLAHGRTGFLCRSDAEMSHSIARLAWDEDLRLAIAARARDALVKTLADPNKILAGWKRLFETVEKTPCNSRYYPTTSPTIRAKRLTCNARSLKDADSRSSKKRLACRGRTRSTR